MKLPIFISLIQAEVKKYINHKIVTRVYSEVIFSLYFVFVVVHFNNRGVKNI